MNEEYTPSTNEEAVLALLHDGRVTPRLVKDETDLNNQQVNYALNQLIAAGWVRKVTTGLYELVGDPRSDNGENADTANTQGPDHE
jgi:predicted Rossmann fold nucleotide-binding protein DprA/Smf involved in DNA uptake